MKKMIEISDEALARLEDGKCVKGSIRLDKQTGKLMFLAYHSRPVSIPADRLICQLGSGWLKESAQRIKFFSSVKKEVGVAEVNNVMERDLNTAMSQLFMTKLAEKLKTV